MIGFSVIYKGQTIAHHRAHIIPEVGDIIVHESGAYKVANRGFDLRTKKRENNEHVYQVNVEKI